MSSSGTSRRRVVSGLLVALLLAPTLSACGQRTATDSTISARELAERIADGSAPLVLDVRTPEEYSGGRAGMAQEVLTRAGYTRVRDLDGHMAGWRRAGLATE